MEHLSLTERKIIGCILDDAAQRGLLVSVWDGEEWTVNVSDNRPSIERAVGTTDATTLRFRMAKVDETGKFATVGQVYLVHGNDCDVIADHSDNEAMGELLARASRLAEVLQ